MGSPFTAHEDRPGRSRLAGAPRSATVFTLLSDAIESAAWIVERPA